MRRRDFADLGLAGLGAGAALGLSVGTRVLMPNPLLRLALTGAAVWASYRFVPDGSFRTAAQGALVVSSVVDVLHLKSWMNHADAPRGGVGAVEAELLAAPSLGAGDAIAASRFRHPLAPAVPVPA